ncbi:MAG: transcriptional regulator, GntR family [Cereibacter sp.]|nr:transcriptional regulator, GntR family [Cereibacter sp.]
MTVRPMYAELSDELIRKIRDGSYAVGSLLPTEIDMAKSRGLSRSTVRAALNRLVVLGLVCRQKGVGTTVIAAAGPSSYGASTASIEELAHFGAATDRKIQSTASVVADNDLARRLGCRPGTRWTLVSALRSEPEAKTPPICWTDNYIDERFADVVEALPTTRGLIADLIADRHGVEVDEVTQRIRPIILGDPPAMILQAVPGSPALEITREYRSAGEVIYVSVSQHPADRFEYRMSLQRHRGQPTAGV